MSARRYKKSQPSLELMPPQVRTAFVDDATEKPAREGNLLYQKKDSFEIPKAFIVVLSGGTVRERRYFNMFKLGEKLLSYVEDGLNKLMRGK